MADQPRKRAAASRRASGDDDQQVESVGPIPSTPRIGTALIAGNTFAVKPVQYIELGGMAIVEGDIALGEVSAVDAATQAVRDTIQQGVAFGVGITGDQFRWPNCRMPYEIDPALPNQQRVTDAIAHWESRTGLRFVVRTTETNWVYFTDAGGCWSLVGMRGGRQTISLGPGCSTGNAIHEIGHAAGLWHEQSREDRDQFVTIVWQNIQQGMQSQFTQHISDGDDLGVYDYGSIMHYPRNAFTANGQATIMPVDPNAQIGQRTGLSDGDVGAVGAMYPACHRIVKQPWIEPVKPFRDPPRFKKILDDDRLLKVVRDPRKPPRDPGPIKVALDPRPNPIEEIVINPGSLVGSRLKPFAIATQHHSTAAAAADQTAESGASLMTALQAQLFEVEAAIGRAQATAAEAGLELSQLQAVREAIAATYDEAISGGT